MDVEACWPGDPWHARWLLAGGMAGEAWLIGQGVATPRERARAADAAAATVLLGEFDGSIARAMLRAIADGWLLLVPTVSPLAGAQPLGEAAVDLLDLVQDPPAEPLEQPLEQPPEEVPPEEVPPEEVHEIDVLVVDALGRPQAGIAYALTFPDGSVATGRTDSDGHLRHADLTQTGTCDLTFPELVQQAAA